MRWNPFEDAEVSSDPYKTLFVGRLNYSTTEKRLRKEYEQYGTIRKVYIIRGKGEKSDKARGYAFIEFEHKKDFLNAYKYGDGKKIDGKRVIADFERGRTVLPWRPRRLGVSYIYI
jgi:U1 small nuclear ribonucleoprotein